MLESLKRWWNRPSASIRIRDAVDDQWRTSLDVQARAKVSIARFYSEILTLEEDGIVISRWDDDPASIAMRGGRRGRLYRKGPLHS